MGEPQHVAGLGPRRARRAKRWMGEPQHVAGLGPRRREASETMISPCFDVHVHLHPERLAEAIQRHFARDGWVATHSWAPEAVAAALRARGVDRFCFFSYAHKPGMARDLNRWVAETARASARHHRARDPARRRRGSRRGRGRGAR